MVVKKIHKSTEKDSESVPSAPDLDQKKKTFQQHVDTHHAATHKKHATKNHHHSPRRRTFIVTLAAVLLVLGGILASCLYMWMQSPQLIVRDALFNAVAARSVTYTGNISLQGGAANGFSGIFADGNSQFTTDLRTPYSGDLSHIKTSVTTTSDGMFVKTDKAGDLIAHFLSEQKAAPQPAVIDSIKREVDGNWIHFDGDNNSALLQLTGISTCMSSLVQKLGTDQSLHTAIASQYAKHPFLTILEDSMFGSPTGEYTVSFDTTKLSDFLSVFNQQHADLFASCSQMSGFKLSSLRDFTIKLTIDKANRVITKFTVTSGRALQLALTVEPMFNQNVTIKRPLGARQLSTVSSELYRQYITTTFQQMGSMTLFVIMGV